MSANEVERRQGAEIERELMQLERRLLLGGYFEAANLVGAAAISLGETLGIGTASEQDRDNILGDGQVMPMTRPRRVAEANRGKR